MKRFLTIITGMLLAFALSACQLPSETFSTESSDTIPEESRDVHLDPLPVVYENVEEYRAFIQETSLPEAFIPYEPFSSVGNFGNLEFPIPNHFGYYDYDLQDANGKTIRVRVGHYCNDMETVIQTTHWVEIQEDETTKAPVYCDAYSNNIVFFGNREIGYYYDESHKLTSITAFVTEGTFILIETPSVFAELTFLEEQNPVSCLLNNDYEVFLSFFDTVTE